MKKNFLIILTSIFFFVLLIFLYLLTVERNPSELPSNLLNKKVPEFKTDSLLANEIFISANEFGNEVVLVNFFATWCVPCRKEHKFIQRFSTNEKIKIIGINYKDKSKNTIRWLNSLGNPYAKIAIDKKGKIAIDWGVYGIPETFIVDSNGIIKYRHVGPITKNIYNKITSLIREIK